MATGHVFIAASLDGYIARPDGDIGWLEGFSAQGEDYGYDAFISSVDGLIIGRGTFEKALTFGAWPYQKTIIVLSASLTEEEIRDDLQGRVRIYRDRPEEIMHRVAGEGWARAYVDGGRVIQSFLRAGLIADMIVTRIPVLLGSGLPLFGHLERDIVLRHEGTTAFASGLVQSKYVVVQRT